MLSFAGYRREHPFPAAGASLALSASVGNTGARQPRICPVETDATHIESTFSGPPPSMGGDAVSPSATERLPPSRRHPGAAGRGRGGYRRWGDDRAAGIGRQRAGRERARRRSDHRTHRRPRRWARSHPGRRRWPRHPRSRSLARLPAPCHQQVSGRGARRRAHPRLPRRGVAQHRRCRRARSRLGDRHGGGLAVDPARRTGAARRAGAKTMPARRSPCAGSSPISPLAARPSPARAYAARRPRSRRPCAGWRWPRPAFASPSTSKTGSRCRPPGRAICCRRSPRLTATRSPGLSSRWDRSRPPEPRSTGRSRAPKSLVPGVAG